MAEITARHLQAFEGSSSGLAETEPEWLTRVRREAIERFAAQGIPGRRDEDFKHTPLGKFLDRDLSPVEGGGTLPHSLPEIDGASGRIVLVDGRFSAGPSRLPEGLRVESMGEALRSARDGVPSWLARSAGFESRSLTALNAANMRDGVLVITDRGQAELGPLHVLHLVTDAAEGGAIHTRCLFVAEPGSEVTIVEQHVGGGADTVANLVTQVVVEENARVHHVKLQEEGERTAHLSSIEAIVGKSGRFEHHSVAVGGSIGRTELRVKLAGEGAECDLFGLYLGRGSQIQDQLTLVDHAMPHGTSRQVYRGILDDKSRGIFNGLVVVREDAQKTLAEQANKNLVLSETAEAHSRPQLDISADDVKCAHGATVGALDHDSLFYLRSRGIGEREARRLLIRAFGAEVLSTLEDGPIRDHAERMITEWLTA